MAKIDITHETYSGNLIKTNPLFEKKSLEKNSNPSKKNEDSPEILEGVLGNLGIEAPSPLLLSKECPDCHGLGRILNARGKYTECICVLKQEANRYLTFKYANAVRLANFDPDKYVGKNLLLQNISIERFRNFVKSFLLLTGQVYSHATVSAQELFRKHWNDTETGEYSSLANTGLLILFLSAEPPNKNYCQILMAIIDRRLLSNLPTWIYYGEEISSQKFTYTYTVSFENYIKKHFVEIKA